MVQFTATIMKFASQGEKTGWSYIKIPADMAQRLLPGNKKSFRVKGNLDNHLIKGVSLLPMGEGDFIMALNASLRKAIRKNKGATVLVNIEVDLKKPQLPADLVDCLKDDPEAYAFFRQLSGSHQNYFGSWIRSAKTAPTREKRIAQCVTAMSRKYNFTQMARWLKKEKDDLA